MADITDGGVGFVFRKKRVTELVHLVPLENLAGTQFLKQIKYLLGIADVGQLGGLIIGLEGIQNILRLVIKIEHKSA